MSLLSSRQSWGLAAKTFHWLAAALVLFLLGFGWWMTHMADRSIRLDMYHLHSVIGYYLGLLLIFRLAWRAIDHATPPLPTESRPWERWAAHGGHIALYVLMMGVTLSGWLFYSAFPRRAAATLFGVIPVPFLLAVPDRAVAGQMEELHKWLSYLLLAVVAVHVGAALRHHFVKRNDVLRRMWIG